MRGEDLGGAAGPFVAETGPAGGELPVDRARPGCRASAAAGGSGHVRVGSTMHVMTLRRLVASPARSPGAAPRLRSPRASDTRARPTARAATPADALLPARRRVALAWTRRVRRARSRSSKARRWWSTSGRRGAGPARQEAPDARGGAPRRTGTGCGSSGWTCIDTRERRHGFMRSSTAGPIPSVFDPTGRDRDAPRAARTARHRSSTRPTARSWSVAWAGPSPEALDAGTCSDPRRDRSEGVWYPRRAMAAVCDICGKKPFFGKSGVPLAPPDTTGAGTRTCSASARS